MMENKRKVVGTFAGKGVNKLRKVSLNAFSAVDGEDDVVAGKEVADSSAKTSNSSSQSIDPEQLEVITKTALWVFTNPDKVNLLLERSKDNLSLAFLSDTHGETAAGRLYLREIAKHKAEKEVQSVCGGEEGQIEPLVHVSQSQIAAFINSNKQHAPPPPARVAESNVPVTTSRERRNRWGPAVESNTDATRPISAGNSTNALSSSSNSSSFQNNDTMKMHHTGTAPSETDEIARMAASFDRTPAEDQQRLSRLIREQQEMQLLESRIREAASQNISRSSDGGVRDMKEVAQFLADNSSIYGTAQKDMEDPYAVAHKGPELLIAEKEAALYLERLAQYEELARLHDDKYRDTVEECERNGGVIEGGTWEHRKRAKEMLQTAGKSLELTLLGAGKHHMADYLPSEVLQRFLINAKQVTSAAGSGADGGKGVGNEEAKIDETNVGFQLLKKSGWTEGGGLGVHGTGIVQPISAYGSSSVTVNVSTNSGGGTSSGSSGGMAPVAVTVAGGRGPEGAGIGVRATHEVAEDDSEFDQYRKRMMLAYRFRPNPLNNPRRNYY